MTRVLGRERSAGRVHAIREEYERPTLEALLRGERLFAASALAQLEPDAFPQSRWWVSRTSGAGPSLVCHSRAGLGEATFTLGPPEGVRAILSLHAGAHQTFATAKPAHLPALEAVYSLRAARTMMRMHVTAETFRRAEGEPAPEEVVLLRAPQARALNRLYGSEGGPTAYEPRHLSEGRYYGIVEEGRLVAVAGTHALSRRYEIAVVGNVFTHPAHRRRGLATQATSVVTAALLEEHRDVVLSVDPANTAAVRTYRRLGYRDAGEIVEAAARRRVGSLTTGMRRLLAGYRGRREGAEIVPR